MKRIHVKNGMKKVLAFSLAAAMVVPGIVKNNTISASAEDVSVPKPAKYFSLERGFVGDGLSQAKFGQLIGMVEESNVFDTKTGRTLGTYKKTDKVLVQGSFDPTKTSLSNSEWHKGYALAAVPTGKEKQDLPDIKTDTGEYIQKACAWNQPTTAYDATKGMVFWLDDTMTNQSYPTYATTVNEETGKPETDMSIIVKDASGYYMEYESNNSAAEYENPFKGASATGFTFSTWLKNTTPYKAPVVYKTLGDLDGSGKPDAKDALIVLKHSLGLVTLDAVGIAYANVNGDKDKNGNPRVDSKDALEILKMSLKLLTEFTGAATFTPPSDVGTGEENVQLLKDSEFFHVERRVIGKSLNTLTNKEEEDQKKILEREYLYFSGNGVTYVGDWTDEKTVCTWTLPEDQLGDETVNLLNAKNGGKWNYVSYTFDGTDFFMYLNGKKVSLTKNAGESYTDANIMKLVSNDKAVTYLGGRGGGMQADYNKYKIQTSSDYYMDDIAIYTSALSDEQAAKAYADAAESVETAKNKKYTVLKTYSFNGTSLKDNELTGVTGAASGNLPVAGIAGKKGNGIQLKAGVSVLGGAQLSQNPFAEKTDLTGVSVSYWIKATDNGYGGVNDGLVLSFIDDEKLCGTEKDSAQGKSQLYLNIGLNGGFAEAATSDGMIGVGNLFKFMPYPYGNPKQNLPDHQRKVEVYDEENNKSYYSDWNKLKNSLANDWNFITVTINNSGFKMYLNGTEVKNRFIDYKGARFCDYYHGRLTELEPQFTRKATNNAGARSLMDFMTAKDTKVYVGFAYNEKSSTSYMSTQDCYLDEITFYDQDLTAAEVSALYDSVK